ncbi:hypothetical protein QQG91_06405 [Marivivens sp. LCG002]|uniref:hypothetical protein n=1 Tax=Marivivens sp. LCG002 TaxID=3051171 RepID=UPI0025542B37|nr:hypothetical protein [Marivivens sp. LCG002]WIV52068.1 hypothetical protein QQG91_06405 [Marivivens sp. LCG002]
MVKLKSSLALVSAVVVVPSMVAAGACDYRPSQLIGGIGAGAAAASAGALATAGLGAKAAGFYTLTNAVTGATMIGSTAGGASAAGTVGIMGGTGGLIGTAAAIVMAPATIIAGLFVGAGVLTYEGVCYFAVDRVDDPKVVNEIVDNLASNADPEFLKIVELEGERYLLIADEHDDSLKAIAWKKYEIDKLYIENGMLKHKDFGPNSQIGKVSLVSEASE